MATGKTMLLIAAFANCASANSVGAGQSDPAFSDYRVVVDSSHRAKQPETGKVAGDEYENIKWALSHYSQPDFAGHYIMYFEGCATDCLNGEIVDWRTGKIIFLPIDEWAPLKPFSFDPISYCRNSSLVIFRGGLDDGRTGVWYYNWNGKTFYLIRYDPMKMDLSGPPQPIPKWRKKHQSDPALCDPGMAP